MQGQLTSPLLFACKLGNRQKWCVPLFPKIQGVLSSGPHPARPSVRRLLCYVSHVISSSRLENLPRFRLGLRCSWRERERERDCVVRAVRACMRAVFWNSVDVSQRLIKVVEILISLESAAEERRKRKKGSRRKTTHFPTARAVLVREARMRLRELDEGVAQTSVRLFPEFCTRRVACPSLVCSLPHVCPPTVRPPPMNVTTQN